nr:periodic tryptophan protein 1 homolog [Leptinotarsa decemlineata]
MEENSQSNINFVPCVRWVKRGVANANPAKVQLSKNELIQIINDTKNKLNVADNEDEVMEGEPSGTDEFNFENYDENDEASTANALGIASLADLPTGAEDNFSESDDSEKEDDLIKPTDNLILVGHVEGDSSILEVYVYNEDECSLYVHHDIVLPSFPLCLEWLNYEPNMPAGNYCAVGTMSPIIEVWDLDMMNVIEPSFTLGKAGSKKKNRKRIGHTDAVLSLAWNHTYDHVMASGSVDKSIILWDMEQKVPSTTINVFGDKVQCLEWHRMEAQTLLAGGCDSTARVFDCRTPEPHQIWQLDGEAERLMWNPLEPYVFLAGTSNGSIQSFDCRKGQLWSVNAHSKEVTGLAISRQCPGLLVTASPDEMVKTWDFASGSVPKLVHEREFKLGNIHCLELCPDSPFVITLGGDNKSNNFAVFDLQNVDVVRQTFESRELVQLVSDGNEESSNSNILEGVSSS